jgi:hypothetical protein
MEDDNKENADPNVQQCVRRAPLAGVLATRPGHTRR